MVSVLIAQASPLVRSNAKEVSISTYSKLMKTMMIMQEEPKAIIIGLWIPKKTKRLKGLSRKIRSNLSSKRRQTFPVLSLVGTKAIKRRRI